MSGRRQAEVALAKILKDITKWTSTISIGREQRNKCGYLVRGGDEISRKDLSKITFSGRAHLSGPEKSLDCSA